MRNYKAKTIKFADEEMKRKLFNQLLTNLNHPNGRSFFKLYYHYIIALLFVALISISNSFKGFDCAEVDLSEELDLSRCPKPNTDGWTSVKISELDTVLDQFPISLPTLDPSQIESIYSYSNGPFKVKNMRKYITLLRLVNPSF